MTKDSLGKLAETQAVSLLMQAGFYIIMQNFKTIYGEIDIVAEKGNTIYLIEVKATRNQDINPLFSWQNRQKRKLIQVFHYFLEEDIFGDTPDSIDYKIIFLWFAFTPDCRLQLNGVFSEIDLSL